MDYMLTKADMLYSDEYTWKKREPGDGPQRAHDSNFLDRSEGWEVLSIINAAMQEVGEASEELAQRLEEFLRQNINSEDTNREVILRELINYLSTYTRTMRIINTMGGK